MQEADGLYRLDCSTTDRLGHRLANRSMDAEGLRVEHCDLIEDVMFTKDAAHSRGVPFELLSDPFPV